MLLGWEVGSAFDWMRGQGGLEEVKVVGLSKRAGVDGRPERPTVC